jgi:paired small multidrug resistance pump
MYIFIGTLFEVGWVIGFKHAGDPMSWVATVAALIVSFYLVIRASIRLPVGTVYAVFTGLGTAGTVIAEMTLFDEPVQWMKIALIAVLLVGVVGLKLSGDGATKKGAAS